MGEPSSLYGLGPHVRIWHDVQGQARAGLCKETDTVPDKLGAKTQQWENPPSWAKTPSLEKTPSGKKTTSSWWENTCAICAHSCSKSESYTGRPRKWVKHTCTCRGFSWKKGAVEWKPICWSCCTLEWREYRREYIEAPSEKNRKIRTYIKRQFKDALLLLASRRCKLDINCLRLCV